MEFLTANLWAFGLIQVIEVLGGDVERATGANHRVAQPVTLDTRPQCGARPSNSFDTGYELGFLTGAIVSRLGY